MRIGIYIEWDRDDQTYPLGIRNNIFIDDEKFKEINEVLLMDYDERKIIKELYKK